MDARRCAIPGAPDESRTLPAISHAATVGAMQPAPATPRAAMLAHLSADMGAALAAGDVEAARVANEAIGKLLAAGEASEGAPVVDLAAERRRREGR